MLRDTFVSPSEEKVVRRLAKQFGGMKALASALGVHRSTIYRYLGGEIRAGVMVRARLNLLASELGMVKPFKEDIELEQVEWLYKQVEQLRERKKKGQGDEYDHD